MLVCIDFAYNLAADVDLSFRAIDLLRLLLGALLLVSFFNLNLFKLANF